MRFGLSHVSCVLGVAVTAVLVMAGTPAGAAVTGADNSAYGASATVSLLPGVLGTPGITVDTGRLAATNAEGPTSASTVDASLRGLVSAKVITSSSHDDTASAKLVQVTLPVLATLAGRTPVVSVISSQCHATADGITGGSDLADLDLGKIGHVSAATPNLKLGIPGVLEVIANEQIHNQDGGLTVNALDIKLLGGGLTSAVGSGHIVLASATCAPADPSADAGPTGTKTFPAPAPGPAPTSRSNATNAPAPADDSGVISQISAVPVGAPQTGDGSLATTIVR